jgi:3-hydroxybutyryl-CoA dehydratase
MNSLRWSDLFVGLTAGFHVEITAEMMDQFRAMSGDSNPLHLDPDFARRAGHRGPVVFGMLTASFYSTLVGVYLPGRFAVLQGLDVDFIRPVFVGDKVFVSGEVSFLSDAVRRVELKAFISDAAGQRVSKARIRAGLHEQ